MAKRTTAEEDFKALNFKLLEPIDMECGIALYVNGAYLIEVNADETYFYFVQDQYREMSHAFPYELTVKLHKIANKLRKELGWNDVR